MDYICEHCGKEIGKDIGGGLFMKRLGEDCFYNFRLCTKCTKEFIAYVDDFVNPCIQNHKVEGPHKIVNEDVLLKDATRQDVRDFLIENGIDDEMAFAISEEVRKGHFSSRNLPEDMMNAMEKAAVPRWFIDGCRKILYLSDRNNYCVPSLVDNEMTDENTVEVRQYIRFEITECG